MGRLDNLSAGNRILHPAMYAHALLFVTFSVHTHFYTWYSQCTELLHVTLSVYVPRYSIFHAPHHYFILHILRHNLHRKQYCISSISSVDYLHKVNSNRTYVTIRFFLTEYLCPLLTSGTHVTIPGLCITVCPLYLASNLGPFFVTI